MPKNTKVVGAIAVSWYYLIKQSGCKLLAAFVLVNVSVPFYDALLVRVSYKQGTGGVQARYG